MYLAPGRPTTMVGLRITNELRRYTLLLERNVHLLCFLDWDPVVQLTMHKECGVIKMSHVATECEG